MVDWDCFLQEIGSFPPHTYNIRPPCPLERVKEEESRLGQIPSDLAEMLRRFNGGEFFIDAIPFITLLGLSLPSDPPGSDWFIDRLTSEWRSGEGRPTDWVIGMTNYGGMEILGQDSFVSEWDSSQQKWTADRYPFDRWVENVLDEGSAYLDEA
jgi:hypothetical protein